MGRADLAPADVADRVSPYLQAMRERLEAVCRAVGPPQVATVAIDGTAVRFVMAGDMAEAVLPALAPRVVADESSPPFVVELWDSASASLPPPSPPWRREDAGPLGAVRGYNDARHKVIVDLNVGTIVIADLAERVAVVWAASAAALPAWWRAAPLRMLLGWILAAPGRHAVHAGAVGSHGRGALLTGRGGSGKSTLAMSCVAAGMEYLGDDYVLLASGAVGPVAHSLYSTVRLTWDSPALRPNLTPWSSLDGEDKAVLDISEVAPSQLRPATAVKAIVIPRRSGARTATLSPVSQGAALHALAPSTLFQASDEGAAAMALIADVVRRVPAFEFVSGSRVEEGAVLLASLLEDER